HAAAGAAAGTVAAAIAAAGLPVIVAAAARSTLATAIQKRQLAPELAQHDLGRIAFLAGLVLPLARLQLPLEVDLRALLQVLLGDRGGVIVDDGERGPLGP